jgi:hypothetical protein
MRNELKAGSPTALPLGHSLRLDGRGALSTERVPESSVMSRLRSFLPEMRHANDELMSTVEGSASGAASVDVENVDDIPEGAPVIQMNLHLLDGGGMDSASASDPAEGDSLASVQTLVAAIGASDGSSPSASAASASAVGAAAHGRCSSRSSSSRSSSSGAASGEAAPSAAAGAPKSALITEL